MLFYYGALVMGRIQVSPKAYPLFLERIHTVFLILFVLNGAGTFANLALGKMQHPRWLRNHLHLPYRKVLLLQIPS
jgi:hypothetical protein